ncbi:baseplate J/gp47 family protein [Streptomyces sp. NPDC005551]|uniref:baseplate J/gp47 family protein n=1 Tax=Streptomyces sp. NPDC005551 TaxID=3364725 RepID=UPI0036A5505A
MTPVPAVDYTAKDFLGFRDAMLSHAKTVIPEWTTRSPSDFGVALVEMLAYSLDIMSYYQDRLVGEAYLSTATQRSSVIEIARTLGYLPYPAQAATGSVTLVTDATQTSAVTVPAGTQVITNFIEVFGGPLVFETLTDVTVPGNGGVAAVSVVEGATQMSDTITLTSDDASPQTLPVVDLGTSTGEVDQVFTIPRTPVDLSTVRVFGVYPDGPIEWVTISSLLDATSSERVIELRTDADGNVSIAFGDGVNGVVPENGVDLKVAYRSGGGTRGNLSAGSLVDIASLIPGVSVQSSSEMSGGYDAESTESIRRNAPQAWGTQDRAVTTADYAALALAVPGVDKANAIGQSTTLISLFLLGARNSTPASSLFEQAVTYVQKRSMAGVTVVGQAGTLVPVNFGSIADPVTVGVAPQYRRSDTQLAVTQALQRLLDPDVTTFGQRVSVASAYAAVHDIPGVLYVHIPMMARADQAQNGTDDVLCREWEVPVPGTIQITAVGGV